MARQWLAFLCATVAAAPALAAEPADRIESTYAEHTRGVELARRGRYDDGLAALVPLLARFPDDYPLQRDVILVTIWKGDCPGALERFERVRRRADLEPYLVVAVSDCLLEANRPNEARRLVRLAAARHPQDASLQHALSKAELALRIDHNVDEQRPEVEAELYNDSSDQGLSEWIGRVAASTRVAADTRLYARYRFTRSTEAQYRDGDFDRAGIGVRYRFDERWLLDQEFAADLFEPGQGGSTTRLVYEPRDAWQLSARYATFAEDIPLRARAAGIEARELGAALAYERRDYRWAGRVGVEAYDFTDTNRRKVLYASAGYAYEMRAQREQRLFLDWYQSRNSLDDAVYFNPGHDVSVGFTHRTDFVYRSRYRRHVDHLHLSAGIYAQQGFDTKPRWSAGYEQDYDFDDDRALVAGLGVARNVYDGKYETEWQGYLYFRQRF